MDQLALIYETSSIVGSNALRPQLLMEIEHYHRVNNSAKRDMLIESITEAEMNYLIDRGILQEVWGGAPNQRSMGQAVKDKLVGTFGGVESDTRNKLLKIYTKMWYEYINFVKSRKQSQSQMRGLGGQQPTQGVSGDMTYDSIVTFLNGFGLNKIVTVLAKEFPFRDTRTQNYDDATKLDKKKVGLILRRALEIYYQGQLQKQTQTNYRPSFQLPPSL